MSRRKHSNPAYPSVRTRRSTVSEPLTKATYQLSASVANAVRTAVQAGAAPSASVLVEEAVVAKLREIRRSAVYAAYAAAAGDPKFLADIASDTDAFDVAVSDGLSEPHQ